MSAVVRPFVPSDAEGVAALFQANRRDVVAEPATDGFVQGGMSATTITRMAGDGGVFVADLDGRLVGFVCSRPPHLPPEASAVGRLIEVAPALDFHGEPIGAPDGSAGWIVYGPIVVDAAYRGQSLARLLLDAVRARWQGFARVGVLFIEESNERSVGVHLVGLGMERIGGYSFDGRAYLVAAFEI